MSEIIVTTKSEIKSILADLLSDLIAETSKSVVKQPSQDILLTARETREKLKISKPTQIEWTKKGKLIGYRLGSRVFYKSADIDQALRPIRT